MTYQVYYAVFDANRTLRRQGQMDPDVRRFIWKPVVLLLGMVIVGAIIDSQLHTSNTFTIIFALFGGVPAIAYYFYREFFK